MASKTIKIGLSVSDIDKAINELKAYKADIDEKTDELRKRVAELIARKAQAGFDSSIASDLRNGGTRKAEVKVTVEDNGTVVLAKGADAVFVEFGAGVYHNTAVGTSPNPKGSELGFTIGSYGKGYGKGNAWGFYEDGELVITRGTPATMPMYNAVKEICNEISAIAREVFK